jgi:tight adherence protein B
MSPVALFILVLLLTFGLLLYLLKPTSTEVAVEQQLAGFGEARHHGLRPSTILKQKAFATNPYLELLAAKFPWTPQISRLIQQSGIDWRVSSVLLYSLCAILFGAGFTSLFVDGLLLDLLVGTALAVVPYFFLYMKREIRFRQFDELLPEAVDLMSRGLSAGHSIAAVIEMVGNEIGDPVGSEFRALYKEQSLGLPLREAMNKLIDRMPRDDMRFLATAILLQKEAGGNLIQILDKTSDIVRERARLRGQLRIYTAQGRVTGWILCFAPFVVFALITLFNREYERPLFTEPFGMDMIYAGIFMMVAGILIIRKIIDIKV